MIVGYDDKVFQDLVKLEAVRAIAGLWLDIADRAISVLGLTSEPRPDADPQRERRDNALGRRNAATIFADAKRIGKWLDDARREDGDQEFGSRFDDEEAERALRIVASECAELFNDLASSSRTARPDAEIAARMMRDAFCCDEIFLCYFDFDHPGGRFCRSGRRSARGWGDGRFG